MQKLSSIYPAGCALQVYRDLWDASSVVLQEETRSGSRVDVTLRLRIIETLSPQDLSGQTPYRDFEISVSSFFYSKSFSLNICTFILKEASNFNYLAKKAFWSVELLLSESIAVIESSLEPSKLLLFDHQKGGKFISQLIIIDIKIHLLFAFVEIRKSSFSVRNEHGLSMSHIWHPLEENCSPNGMNNDRRA